MGKWLFLSVVIISGTILGYFYYAFENRTGPQQLPFAFTANPGAISLIDGYKDGIHRVNGTVKLPHSCYTIDTTAAADPKDAKSYTVALVSKDHILDQPVCANITTRYPFEALIEAPQDITLHLTLNGTVLPIVVTHTDWQNPAGNIINETPGPDKPITQ